jgi:hypothetical protein
MKPKLDAGNDTAAGRTPRDGAGDDVVVGEPRWAMAGAVLAAMVLTILLPSGLRLGPRWVLPLIEGLLLVAVVAGDPGRITRRSRELRALSIALVFVLVFNALWATVVLIDHLIQGGAETNSAGDLLRAGTVVWVSNNIAFALLYWELNPRIAPDWRPRFIDYLYLGFTNATALSPTDAMPLAPWAKIAMTVQSLISLAILALVVARAVNVFT